jgi:hypothetical protein
MKQFCPGPYPLKYKIKIRLHKQKEYDYKFHTRLSSNLNIMERIFAKLHYLGSHSYVTEKWHKHERKLLKQHPNRF